MKQKILAVSLLRLGDFLMLTPTLKSLKRRAGVELHVLVHPETLLLRNLFPEVDVWHVIERRQLQTALGTSDAPFFLAHDLLLEMVEQLSAIKFDSVINFTHTEFSGWVSGAIDAKDRVGLHYDLNGNAGIHSTWFQYLNNHVAAGAKEVFHLVDVLYFGAGLTDAHDWEIKDTSTGVSEAQPYRGKNLIALQVLTSDTKKNWSTTSWLSMLTQIQTISQDTQFVALGSPLERERLQGFVDAARSRGVKIDLAICSLEGALAIVRNAKLLITGDTSIKHLACGTKTPVLEISLGSSDWRKTGVYKQDSVIVQPIVACAPCPHSKACNQPSHRCAEQVSAEAIALTAIHLIGRRWQDIRKIAYEFQTELQILQTHICPMGFWVALPLHELNESHLLQTALDRSTWKFILQREYLNPLAQFGSEGLQIKRWLESHISNWSLPRVSEGLSFIESETETTDQEINSLLNTLRQITDGSSSAIEDLKSYFENTDASMTFLPWLGQLQDLYRKPEVVPITGLRKVQNRLDEVFQKTQVKLKLIRSIKSQLSEKI